MSSPKEKSASALASPALGVAVVGAGTVGGGVLDMLRTQRELLQKRCGYALNVSAVVKRNLADAAHLPFAECLTDDWRQAVANPDTDIVVELMGGCDAAAECVRAALEAGKPVVTANKALLAETSGSEGDVLALAAARHLPVAHEAAIAGCIPVVKTLHEALSGDSVHEIYGVINGTCNYILTAMEAAGASFEEALAQAQQLGFAEADPTLDIDGIDAAHKLLLITRMAFGCHLTMADIPVCGVRGFDARDIAYARQLHYRVKLLAVAKRSAAGVELRVRPAMLPRQHSMASVEGATNAVVIKSQFAGETMYTGAGAGAHPTATAVVADIMDIARRFGAEGYRHSNGVAAGGITPPPLLQQFSAPFYLRLRVIDRPGVIADITRLLAERGISIEAMHQNEAAPDRDVDIVILLHHSSDAQVQDGIRAVEQLPTVTAPVVAIPIEKLI